MECQPKALLNDFFVKFGYDYSFAGWNVCFDVIFFRRICEDFGFRDDYMKINHRHLDVQSVAKACSHAGILQGTNGNLSSLCNLFKLKRNCKHSAYQDAFLAFEVYKKLIELINL